MHGPILLEQARDTRHVRAFWGHLALQKYPGHARYRAVDAMMPERWPRDESAK